MKCFIIQEVFEYLSLIKYVNFNVLIMLYMKCFLNGYEWLDFERIKLNSWVPFSDDEFLFLL